MVYGSVATEEHKVSIETPEEDKEPRDSAEDAEEAARLHIKIKELIDEKQFTEERLAKALTYYEVGSIDELCWEGAHNFIQQLLKL